MKYYFMHKDVIVANLEIYTPAAYIESFEVCEPSLLPSFIVNRDTFNEWWRDRAVPQSRNDLREMLEFNGVISREVFLLKNLALNLSDCYWVKPYNLDVSFKDVNLFTNPFEHIDISRDFSKKDKRKVQSYSPDSSTTGEMLKSWAIEDGKRVLTKYVNHNDIAKHQCVNEIFASYLHKSLNLYHYVDYTLAFDAETGEISGVSSECFSSIDKEFIPISDFLSKESIYYSKGSELKSDIVKALLSHTDLDEGYILNFIDYLNITDFLITNEDRHLNNYGILRDANTLKCFGFAPIFDSGNSMMYKSPTESYFREMKSGKIHFDVNMYKTDEKNARGLKKGLAMIDMKSLPKSDFVFKFYSNYLKDDSKAEYIARLYDNKLRLLALIHDRDDIHEIFKDRFNMSTWSLS